MNMKYLRNAIWATFKDLEQLWNIREYKVKWPHQKDMGKKENEERVISAWTKGVSKEDKNEEARAYLKEKRQVENSLIKERSEIIVQPPSFKNWVIWCEAPGETDNRSDDRDGGDSVEGGQVSAFDLEQAQLKKLVFHQTLE